MDYAKEGPGDYYQLPKKSGKECIIDPYIYPIQGKPTLITSLVAPIMIGDKFFGIAGIDLKLDHLQGFADNVKDLFDGTGKILLISNGGNLAAVTDRPELAGKHMKNMHEDWEEDLEYIFRIFKISFFLMPEVFKTKKE